MIQSSVSSHSKKEMQRKRFSFVSRVVTYLPPFVFVVLWPLSNVFPNILDALSVSALLALVGSAILGIGMHLESRYDGVEKGLAEAEREIASLKDTQMEYLDKTKRPVVCSTIAAGFKEQASIGSQINTLRVFAISSQQILSFLQNENFIIQECRLLIRASSESSPLNEEFKTQILLTLRDWNRLAKNGRIRKLVVRSYDFLPTEYQVIFDDRAMLAGLYLSDPTDYSEVSVVQPLYIDGASPDGRAVIKYYLERYDSFFDICTLHHGSDAYNEHNYEV